MFLFAHIHISIENEFLFFISYHTPNMLFLHRNSFQKWFFSSCFCLHYNECMRMSGFCCELYKIKSPSSLSSSSSLFSMRQYDSVTHIYIPKPIDTIHHNLYHLKCSYTHGVVWNIWLLLIFHRIYSIAKVIWWIKVILAKRIWKTTNHQAYTTHTYNIVLDI